MSKLHRTDYESTIYQNPTNLTNYNLQMVTHNVRRPNNNVEVKLLHLTNNTFRKHNYIIKEIEY